MKRSIKLLGLAVLVALGSDKALTGTAGSIGGGDRWQFRLRLSAPEPHLREDASRPELGAHLAIPTFGQFLSETGRAAADGQIPLPVKVVRVAIPEGATVGLENIQAPGRLLRGLRLGAGDRARPGGRVAGSGPTAAPGTGGTITASGAAVRLGDVGYFRFQRFVEVIYTPVRPQTPPDADGFADYVFHPEVEADVVVEGVDRHLVARLAASVPADPWFEDSYRSALLNYEEGRGLRSRPGTMDELSASSGGAALLSPFAAASTPVYRVIVREDGIYRLPHAWVQANAPGLLSAAPDAFKLTNRGVETPIRVVTAAAGQFVTGDYIEFYGEGMVHEPDLVPNHVFDPNMAPGVPPILMSNDFTDDNVYFLFGEAGPRARIPDQPAPHNNGLPLQTSFIDTVRREFDDAFVPIGSDDPFYEANALASNTGTFVPDPNAANCGFTNPGATTFAKRMGPASDPNSVGCLACTLALPDPLSVSDPAVVRARLRGASSEAIAGPDHMTVVQVGTTASRSSTMCWDGETVVEQSVTVPQNVLASASGIFIAQPGLGPTTGTEFLFLDSIEATYRRSLRLNGGQVLGRYPNDADRSMEVGNFGSCTPSDMIVYDISATVPGSTVPSPRRLTGGTAVCGSPSAVRLTLPRDLALPGGAGATRLVAAAGAGGFRTPAGASEMVPGDDLLDTSNAADMVIITHPGVVGTPPVAALGDYVAHRETFSGLSLKVVMIRDVYDQFSDGLETPQAIRDFLAYAVTGWATPPSYVMLLGDTSADYKNNAGFAAWINQVPTFIMHQPSQIIDYYASDTYLSAILGSDQIPDLHLGRITARTPAEVTTIFTKLMDYDLSPPPGPWRAHALLLADRGKNGNTGESAEFEGLGDEIASTWFVPPFTAQRIYYDDPNYIVPSDPNMTRLPADWRADYLAAANQGAALTAYVGHGAFDVWGGSELLLRGSDLAGLQMNGMPTLLVNENCLVGGFHSVNMTSSLGESYLKSDASGAAAVFGPAAISFTTVGQTINDAIYPAMFGLTKERRFGHLITEAKLAMSFALVDLQSYVLLGDPAQRLVLPAPRPPVGFHAIGDLDARVDLAWSPGPDPGVRTRVYRRDRFDSNWTLRTPAAGVTGTSWSDTGVINGTAYFYRATSVDPNGVFEGAVTSTGSDCNVFDPNSSGPGCVWAVPKNPNAPLAPAGFAVDNPGTGDQLLLSWAPGGEPDLREYLVEYGVTPGVYTASAVFPAPAGGAVLGGLTEGQVYFLTVHAVNTSDRVSAPAPEQWGRPSVFEGINPPGPITSLDVRKAAAPPSSVELLWTPPPFDIYGGPARIASYTIYRGTSPAYVPMPANVIGVVNDPNQTSFVDPNAFSLAAPHYFYLIAGTDDRGFVSGVGRQLPAGITALLVARSGSNLVLTWPPVMTDIDGGPTMVDHYIVYADTQPVGRSRTDTMAPLVPATTNVSITTPIPPGFVTYYSVIVVDTRGNKSPF